MQRNGNVFGSALGKLKELFFVSDPDEENFGAVMSRAMRFLFAAVTVSMS